MMVFNATDAESGEVSPFTAAQIAYLEALAAQAAVVLERQKLIVAQDRLLDTLVRTLGEAIDAKSEYTGRHCARVPELAVMLAKEAHNASSGPLADFAFHTDDQWREFCVGAWLHDCGKITTPEHVLDKATKLETVYNRVHEIRTRFEVLLRDVRIEALQAQLEGRMDAAAAAQFCMEREQQLQEDFAFIAVCNIGSEKMDSGDRDRIRQIAQQRWLRHFDDRLGLSLFETELRKTVAGAALPVPESLIADQPWHLIPRSTEQRHTLTEGFRMEVPEYLYNHGELYNLCVERGTLNEEERFKVNEHIIHTLRMLEGAQFPPHLRRVPEYAGTHHEAMDGSGYPRGLTAEQLSIPARIMAIADIFEALTASDRPYKPAKSLSESLRILQQLKIKGHIDPDLFALFLRSGVYMRYAERFLGSGQIDVSDITPYLE
jgi:HD-GYP domain-containing protein (c-di-GMP phosphodiesterase class II)